MRLTLSTFLFLSLAGFQAVALPNPGSVRCDFNDQGCSSDGDCCPGIQCRADGLCAYPGTRGDDSPAVPPPPGHLWKLKKRDCQVNEDCGRLGFCADGE